MAQAGQDGEVKLLGAWFSPFSYRVELALRLKGVPYEVVEQDLVNKSPLLVKHNPICKKVPVLLHNGKPIVESFLILEYIDETWKNNPILPQDPYKKAMDRFWAKFIEEKFTEVVRIVIATEGEQQEKVVEQAKEALEILEGEIKGKKYFGGNSIGFADIALGCITIWLDVVEEIACVKILDPEKYPLLNKWKCNFVALPVVQQNMPQSDKLVQYLAHTRQLLLASAAAK